MTGDSGRFPSRGIIAGESVSTSRRILGACPLTAQPPRLPDEHDATLKPPQFTLRTLMIGTTAAAALLALMTAVGTVWSLAILFFALLLAAHVVGNSLGTRLRDGGIGRSARSADGVPPRHSRRKSPSALPSPTRLRERSRLHWINLVLTLGGVAVGGYYGGTGLAATYPEATAAAHVLAYVSSGVLVGFAVFALSSFLTVVRQVLSEAHAGGDRRPAARRSADSIERK